MALTDASSTRLAFVEEATEGTTPATPAWQVLRYVSDSLNIGLQSEISNEIRSDRNISDITIVGGNYGGDVVAELSYATFDTIFESVVGGKWTKDPLSTAAGYLVNDTALLDDAEIDVDTGSGDFKVGDVVQFAGDNTEYTILADANAPVTNITFTPGLVAVPADNATVTVVGGPTLLNGTSRTPVSMEKTFTDADGTSYYHRGSGVLFGNMSFEIVEKSLTAITFTALGRAGTTDSAIIAGATYVAANSNPVLDASNDVSGLALTGTGLTGTPIVKGLTLQVNANLREQAQVGSLNLAGIGLGRLEPSGEITIYFEDNEEIDALIAQTDVALTFVIGRTTLEKYQFTLPKMRFSNPRIDTQGINTDVVVIMDWTAIFDATENASIKIERHVA